MPNLQAGHHQGGSLVQQLIFCDYRGGGFGFKAAIGKGVLSPCCLGGGFRERGGSLRERVLQQGDRAESEKVTLQLIRAHTALEVVLRAIIPCKG